MDKNNLIEDFKNKHPDKTLIYLYKAGSHFFNLNTPSSDIDLKGVYLPSAENYEKSFNSLVKFNSNNKGRNTSEDVDIDIFSLPFFLNLLAKGDFNMMEALYAPEDKILLELPLMTELKDIRKSLMVKDVRAFFGFFDREYRQHNINHNFHSTRVEMYNFLKPIMEKIKEKYDNQEFIHGSEIRLSGYAKELKAHFKDHKDVRFYFAPVSKDSPDQEFIEFARSKQPMEAKVSYVMDALEQKINNASHRKKDGKAYKGLSHCLRLLYEAQQLLSTGEFQFPFSKERTELLYKAKTGQLSDETIKDLIESELEKTRLLEDNTPEDKHAISIIEKLQFRLLGKMKLEKMINSIK